jgi:uncharacterized membrane protein YhiD involved in acid resistance
MPDWLKDSFHSNVTLSEWIIAARLAAAFGLGVLVAGIYRFSRRSNTDPSSFVTTLVLLTVLIGMVSLVIGDSVARAFSLVGALAIVRFRTVVEDTRDTAFVILAVGVGMAAGTGFLAAALIAMPFAAIAAVLFRPRDLTMAPPTADYQLMVRVGLGHQSNDVLRVIFDKHLERARLTLTATARQGTAFEMTYAVRLRNPDGAMALVTELNAVEGIQGVELRTV